MNIRQGEIVTMIGPSGAGKTTLLWAINWLNAPDEGQIEFNGAAIDAKTATKKQISGLRGKSAMVFQHYNLFRNKTALENVTQSLLCVKKMNKQDAVLRGRQLLDRVGLPTGALARIVGNASGPVITIHADIDVLPITEASELAYSSENAGRMHACGHDFHTTALLGAQSSVSPASKANRWRIN